MEADSVLAKQILHLDEGHGPEGTYRQIFTVLR